MANFNPTIITDSGLSLIAKISSGSSQMRFTRICTSKSSYSVDEAQHLTELTTVEQETTIDKVEIINDTAVKVSAVITNKLLESGYYINAIGLYAEDPDLGEILYSITIAKVPDWMQPDSGSGVSSLLIQLITQVSNSSIVKTELNPSVLATVQDLEDLKNSFPTTLPANGGNADTVGKLYPNEFMQNQHVLLTGNIKEYLLNNISGCVFVGTEVTEMPYSGWWFVSIEKPNGVESHIVAHAKSITCADEYRRIYNATAQEWSYWVNVADGGNAYSLGGKPKDYFMQWIGLQTDTTIIGNANFKCNYHCNVDNGTRIDLPVAGWYHIVYYLQINNNGYGMQIAYPLNFDGATMIRRAEGTKWGAWKNVADGGNASSLGGYTVSGCNLMSNQNPNGGNVSLGTFNDTNGDWGFLDVLGANGNRTRVQMSSEQLRPRAYHYDSATNTWTEAAYHMAAYASVSEPLTASNFCLRNLASGTLPAENVGIPVGSWYGQYE